MRNRWEVLVVAVLAFSTVAFSQNHVPVIQDGTPAVLAQKPAPRTPSGKPDLSGVWGVPSDDELKMLVARLGYDPSVHGAFGIVKAEPPSWTAETRPVPDDPGREREVSPFFRCLPPGPTYLITGWGSNSIQEVLQTDKRVLMIYEYDHAMRQIWTDGRKHPDQVDLTWVGDSIGTWDGDTLVVDTVGLRTEWGLGGGRPSSPNLHIVERYRRLDNDTLQIDFTYDDPKVLKKPWTRTEFRRLRPTWQLIEDPRCYPGSPELKAQEDYFK